MKKIIIIFVALLCTNIAQSKVLSINELLKVKLGGNEKGIDLKGEAKDYSYEIEIQNQKVVSIEINFYPPVLLDQYLKKMSKGHCLVQSSGGDVHQNRYFFFNQELTHRYELNESQKVKSILVRELPGARENKECLLGDLFKKMNEVNKIVKVK